jgi:predicted enzyme related to lactoylglutathione lyase
MMVSGLRFVQLEVEDLSRSVGFYRDSLGLRVEEAAPSQGQRMACVEVGGYELVLIQTRSAESPRGAGMQLFLNTHDVDHFSTALRSRGVEAATPTQEPWGGRVTRVRDPDGYLLCFVQSRPQMMMDEP